MFFLKFPGVDPAPPFRWGPRFALFGLHCCRMMPVNQWPCSNRWCRDIWQRKWGGGGDELRPHRRDRPHGDGGRRPLLQLHPGPTESERDGTRRMVSAIWWWLFLLKMCEFFSSFFKTDNYLVPSRRLQLSENDCFHVFVTSCEMCVWNVFYLLMYMYIVLKNTDKYRGSTFIWMLYAEWLYDNQSNLQ